MDTPRRLMNGLLVAVVLQFLYYYPQLPQTVASHFDAAGRPNGWSSKEAFFGLYAFMVALQVLIFRVLPPQLGRLPSRLFSLPNRDYWLAPERRQETLGYFTASMAWFGFASILFAVITIQLVIEANLAQAPLNSAMMWVLLAAFLLFVFVWVARLLLRFARKP